MNSLLKQIRQRRLLLGLKQSDMPVRIGISRQQYHRLESKGNPSLSTLELIATGLKSKIMLIPQDKLAAVKKILKDSKETDLKSIIDNPWDHLPEDNE